MPAILLLFGCGEAAAPSGGPVLMHQPGSIVVGPPAPVFSEFTLCEFGTDATFDLSINSGPASTVSLLNGECKLVYTNTGPFDLASIFEHVIPNVTLDTVHISQIVGALNNPTPLTRDTTIVGITGTTQKIGLEQGSVVSFYARGRHTVAALLNGASGGVSYDFTVSDVINGFNAVYPGTRPAYIGPEGHLRGLQHPGLPAQLDWYRR